MTCSLHSDGPDFITLHGPFFLGLQDSETAGQSGRVLIRKILLSTLADYQLEKHFSRLQQRFGGLDMMP